MRKVLLWVLAAAVVLSLGAASAFAEGPIGGNYTDADGDGVCDNYTGGQTGGRGQGNGLRGGRGK